LKLLALARSSWRHMIKSGQWWLIRSPAADQSHMKRYGSAATRSLAI